MKGLALILTSVPCLGRAGFTGEGTGLKHLSWDRHHFDSSSFPGWTRLVVPRGDGAVAGHLFIPGNQLGQSLGARGQPHPISFPHLGKGGSHGIRSGCDLQETGPDVPTFSMPEQLHWPVLWGRGGASSSLLFPGVHLDRAVSWKGGGKGGASS